ncbi:ribosome assembly RNA-binding protein YhbY [Moraxella sp. ZY210820]|uniref:ribosome assembly RNA-binding protein YhbY n=1 Tax=unclassified Moraxella TaxID=2685852 RepID=UPI00272FB2C4|nr:ribosome assembly RNA-binding protein YhbY [Moraxella sp. ZY210820]WLF83735.1 ribosome assembly RNA-binding protein YhbY [Moraxella sp. ZY210820]
MSRQLSTVEIKKLRAIGHHLNPVVMLGSNGLTDAVLEETERALNDHELIKIKVAGEDRELRQHMIEQLAEETQAHVVQKIGKMALLYRKAVEQNQNLSNIVRFAHLSH